MLEPFSDRFPAPLTRLRTQPNWPQFGSFRRTNCRLPRPDRGLKNWSEDCLKIHPLFKPNRLSPVFFSNFRATRPETWLAGRLAKSGSPLAGPSRPDSKETCFKSTSRKRIIDRQKIAPEMPLVQPNRPETGSRWPNGSRLPNCDLRDCDQRRSPTPGQPLFPANPAPEHSPAGFPVQPRSSPRLTGIPPGILSSGKYSKPPCLNRNPYMSSKGKARTTKLEYVEPIGLRVLVRKDEPKRETKGGIALPDAAEIPTITGRIVTISRAVHHDADIPLRQYDKVLFHPKNAIPVDFESDNQLFVVPTEDIVAVFRAEPPVHDDGDE